MEFCVLSILKSPFGYDVYENKDHFRDSTPLSFPETLLPLSIALPMLAIHHFPLSTIEPQKHLTSSGAAATNIWAARPEHAYQISQKLAENAGAVQKIYLADRSRWRRCWLDVPTDFGGNMKLTSRSCHDITD